MPHAPLRRLTPAIAACLALTGLALTGCQAERSILAPAEPTWSYHDGAEQLSNNDAWRQMVPQTLTGLLNTDSASIASVEDASTDIE